MRRDKFHFASLVLGIIAAALYFGTEVGATPSTQVWIPSTDIQSFKTVHLGVDNYTTFFRKEADGGGDFPTDFGLTAGILPGEKIQGEVGIDLFEPSDDPLYFNAKLAIPEGAFCPYSPALAVGGYAFGTESGATDYDIIYGLAAITFDQFGRISLGYYTGNDELLVDEEGNEEADGILFSWDRTLTEISDRLWLAVDYQGGDNAFGAFSVGAAWSFTEDVSMLVGYDFFNNNEVAGKDTVTVQLDINF